MKSFDTQIRPILEYGVEIWYQPKPIQEIESVQLKFMKSVLGVRQQTPTLALYGETGRFPLYLRQQDLVLKYWRRLQKLDKDTILYKIYSELVDLDLQGYKTWVTKARTICLIEDSIEAAHGSHRHISVPGILLEHGPRYCKFAYDWHIKINDSETNPKLRTYKRFKKSFRCEPYLKCIRNKSHLNSLIRFRTSSHNLAIETGRHSRPALPIEKRTCKFCPDNPIDDEMHMLLQCSYHNGERCKLLSVVRRHIPVILNTHILFEAIMSHTHPETLCALGRYLYVGFKKRENFI